MIDRNHHIARQRAREEQINEQQRREANLAVVNMRLFPNENLNIHN